MSRRPAPVEELDQCLLCGASVQPMWQAETQEYLVAELCHACNVAFQDAADRVATWYAARATGLVPAAPAVVQVPGQLELDELVVCHAPGGCDCEVFERASTRPADSFVCLCGHLERFHDGAA